MKAITLHILQRAASREIHGQDSTSGTQEELQMVRGQLSVPGLLCTSLRQRSVQNPGHDLHELDIDPSCNHSKTPKFLVTLRRIESKVLLLTRSAGNKCSGRQKLERSL